MEVPKRKRSRKVHGAPSSSTWLREPISIPTSSSSPIAAALWAELRHIDSLFDLFSNSKHVIDPDGVEKLCRCLEMKPSDVKILMLAWKMDAEKQGYFHRDEWRRGLRRLKVDSMEKLKKALFCLEREARIPPNFEDFFAYSFRYCLIDERQTSLEMDIVCELLELVMGHVYYDKIQSLIEFLKIQTEYRALVMDQWTSIFRFCNEIRFPNLGNYNTDEGWPAIFDSFVEWFRSKAAAQAHFTDDAGSSSTGRRP